MEYATIAGNYYTITSKSGCSVTDSTGTLSMTVEAGGQLTVQAPSDKLVLDDEQAIVFKANFKNALAALGMLGGGSGKLPANYTPLEFLESTGGQYIETDIITDINDTILLDCQNLPAGTRSVARYILTARTMASDESEACIWAWGTYENAGYFAFVWRGAIGGTVSLKSVENPSATNERMLVWIEREDLKINDKKISLNSNDKPQVSETSSLTFFSRWGVADVVGRIFSLHRNKNKLSQRNALLPCLSPTGAPCMFDTVNKKPYHNSGSGQFIAGIKDAAQLRTVLRKLPDLTGQDMGKLTLAIPAEANTPEMQELLDSTETQKNWELTIQARAAAATYSLRRVRQVVWVRRAQSEYGSYVDSLGSRWQVEWCSAIYSPRGNDPTLHGYEPFDSVEQAVEAWGLVPYEYPEEELSTIA